MEAGAGPLAPVADISLDRGMTLSSPPAPLAPLVGRGEERWVEAGAGPLAPVADKSLDRGMTFNRSQRRSCSATYDTLTQNQVVCR